MNAASQNRNVEKFQSEESKLKAVAICLNIANLLRKTDATATSSAVKTENSHDTTKSVAPTKAPSENYANTSEKLKRSTETNKNTLQHPETVTSVPKIPTASPEPVNTEKKHQENGNDQHQEPLGYKPQHSQSFDRAWLHVPKSKHDNYSENRSGMAFLGSSSNVNLLFEPQEEGESFHYKLPGYHQNAPKFNELDNEELEILKFRGAFLLPSRDLCDQIIEAYFEKIHPTLPILNRSQFMRRYNNPSNPPSLLLLQAILLAGSRVCNSPALLDDQGSADLASFTFYKRAKALFDANYESDPITVVQSVILLGWWWEGPEDVTKNSFYWTRVALSIAQGFGLHRSVENSNMPLGTKRTWKKMWWSLFLRDRWSAIALGRPVLINLEDSDVSMLTEDDFIEDEPDMPALFPINRVQVLAFIHSVKLSEIMGMVLRQQFSVNAEISRRQNKVPVVSHCDMAMGSWMSNLPPELKFSVKDKGNHNFFVALLHAQYYTVLCLVHRSNILRKGHPSDHPYPSWGIAFQAAHMISRIFENLLEYEEVADSSAFYVYTLFSAAIMLLYQTESPMPSVVESAKKAMNICVSALKEIGKKWLIARMIVKLFDQLDSNKSLRDQFVKDARKRAYASTDYSDHHKSKKPNTQKTSANLTLPKNKRPDSNAASPVNFGSPSAPTGLQKTSISQTQNLPTKSSPSLSHTASPHPAPSSVNLSSKVALPRVKRAETWTNAVQSLSSSPANSVKSNAFPGTNDENHLNAFDPEFLFVANNLPDSQSFYQNFQPSQLFPDPNEGETRSSFSNILTISPSAIFGDSAGSSNSSTNGQTPPKTHANLSNQSSNFNNPVSSAISPLVVSSPLVDPGSVPSPTHTRNDSSEMIPNTLNPNDWYQYFSLTFQDSYPNAPGALHDAGLSHESPEVLNDILSLHATLENPGLQDVITEMKPSDTENRDSSSKKHLAGH